MRHNLWSHLVGLALLALSILACSTPKPSPTVPPTSTPAVPPAPTSTAPPAPTPTVEMPEWDYVAMGESITFETVSRYAEILEQDLGVQIDLHDWQAPSEHSSNLLKKLRRDELLRRDIREAEVITFLIPLGVIAGAMRTFELGEPGACGGIDNQDCLREAFATYMADTDAIMAEIVSLCSPSEALIRVQDTWQLKVRETQATGSFEMFNQYWREANAHVIQVATSYHIPVARVYGAFMGPDGVQDPRDFGLLQSDGLHPTLEGSALVAELFRELGYEYAPPGP
jgi:hypothetical protein